ncbi:hypothetical protein E3Q02_00725 [Wallemia mellicola]|uniref:polynucleotide adenylyltransferase n=1 Tax=Wallemia mellicola TaxID=1708541 RepID=A0AB38MZ12_9BASI|nr:hypothetical protein E3Q02_00725 [Wallemia mellicola]
MANNWASNSMREALSQDLTGCLFSFILPLLPTAEEYAIKEQTRLLLEKLIDRVSPGARLIAFGSMANGFALRNSDPASEPLSSSELTTIVGELIRHETNFHVKPLPKARIPIIKLTLAPTPALPYGIACDIGFGGQLALENTRLLLGYASIDPPRLRTLVLFIKVWSKRRKINSAYRGTLSSYGFTLLVIFFLAHVKQPPVLPNLQRIPPLRPVSPESASYEGRNIYFFDDVALLRQEWSSANTQSVGELLWEFFRFYAKDFNYTHDVISIRTEGGILSKDAKGWVQDLEVDGASEFARDRNRLCIEDPFDTTYNVARTVTADGLYTIRGEFMRASRMLQTVGKTDILPSQVLVDLCEEREEALVPAPFSAGNRTPRPLTNPSLGPTLGPSLHPPPSLQPPPIVQTHSHNTHMTQTASQQSYSPTQSQSSIFPSRKVSDQISSPPATFNRRRQSSSHAQALSIALNVAQNERMRNAHEEHLMYQHPQSHTKPLGSAFWEAENLVSDESTRTEQSSSIPRRASSGANVGPTWLSRLHERKYAPKHHLKATIPNVSGPYADATTQAEIGWPPVPIPAPLRHSPRLANAALHSRASSSAAAVAAAATTANSVNASPSQLIQKQIAANNSNMKIRVPTFVTNGAGQQIRITPSTFTQPSESGTPTNSPPLSTTSTLSAPVTSTAQPSRNGEEKEQTVGLGLGFPPFPQAQRYTFGQNTFVASESLTTSALTLAADVRVPPPRMSARRWLKLQKQAAARNTQTPSKATTTTATTPSTTTGRKLPTRSRSVPSTPRVSNKTSRISSREFEKSVGGGRTYSRIIPNATLPLLDDKAGDATNVDEDTPPFKPNLTTGLEEGFPALSNNNSQGQFKTSSSLNNLYSASLQASRKKQQQQQQSNKEKRRSASVGSETGKNKLNTSKKKSNKDKQHQRNNSSQSTK